MSHLVGYAINNVKFYKDFYKSKKFSLNDLNCFDDIQKIPIIDKTILRKYDIELRSSYVKSRYGVNTGGTSGSPFSFYITPDSMGTEWAHMHNIWSNLGFKHSDLKIVFSGRSNVSNGIEYDSVRHSYALDLYADYQSIYDRIYNIFSSRVIKYFHGYPSAIYDFVLFLEKNNDLLQLVKKNLKGVLLGSEYPIPLYRDKIELTLKVKTISWYGHTERVILAGEKNEKGKYYPFQTYGFVEAEKLDDQNYSLIGTSYYNFTSPFIRYNTDDIITDIVKMKDSNILESFKIKEGRKGEYIIDEFGKNIPLTGLIFGRHHKIFDYIDYIQISQKEIGFATILYVSKNNLDCRQLFDTTNINIKFKFMKIPEPIKTNSGKVLLKV
jgi:phenylacetate-CoA ligase